MSYLLDTCVISELIKAKPNPAVLKWISGQAEDRLYLSVLTFGEIEKGIAKLKDATRAEKLTRWVEKDLQQRFAGRWLDVTYDVARRWGKIQGEAELAGLNAPVLDGLIAATALQFGCSVVTRNVADFAASKVQIVNPWIT